MRSNGIDESYITGDKSDYDKFKAFCGCLQYAIGNPLYHWTHLELKRYFNVDEVVTAENCDTIWEKCNKVIKETKMSPSTLINQSNVAVLCTTDDPIDSLEYHKLIAEKGHIKAKVLPAFRPDRLINIEKTDFTDYIKRRCIKKTREYIIFPKLDPFTEENLYKFSNLKFSGQDAADLLTEYLDLESYIYDQLDECYEDLLLQKLEYYTITKYLKDPVDCGVITEDELKLIHALNQINDAKSVKVMWNYHGVKFENKMEIEKIRLKMNNCNDFYHEWDFPTSRHGENIINSLKQTLLSEKQIRVKTEHISAIYYRGKEIFSK